MANKLPLYGMIERHESGKILEIPQKLVNAFVSLLYDEKTGKWWFKYGGYGDINFNSQVPAASVCGCSKPETILAKPFFITFLEKNKKIKIIFNESKGDKLGLVRFGKQLNEIIFSNFEKVISEAPEEFEPKQK